MKKQKGNIDVTILIIGLIIFGFFLILLATKYTPYPTTVISTPSATGRYEVSDIFWRFYEERGGEAVLGKAISNLLPDQEGFHQFFENGRLNERPNNPLPSRITLEPLGYQLFGKQPQVAKPDQPGVFWYNGYISDAQVYELYQRFGVNLAGKPISDWIFDPVTQRYQQCFEYVCWEQRKDESRPRLMALGVEACRRDRCTEDQAYDSIIIRMHKTDDVFQTYIDNHNMDWIGYAISPAYINANNKYEQIFQGVVLNANKDKALNSVTLRPLSNDLQILADEPRQTSGSDNVIFYPITRPTPPLGYDIPLPIWNFIVRIGGSSTSGGAITHLRPLEHGLQEQCFVNFCVLYDAKAAPGRQIRLKPLGQIYDEKYYRSPSAFGPPPTVNITVRNKSEGIGANQSQTIFVRADNNGISVPGARFKLILKFPGGEVIRDEFEPTDADGLTELTVGPLNQKNAAKISYRVCPMGDENSPECKENSYFIWDLP